MDHSRAPALEALRAFREQGLTPFNPPGHAVGRSGLILSGVEPVGVRPSWDGERHPPNPDDLALETVTLPRGAFGRCGAEMITPSPPCCRAR